MSIELWKKAHRVWLDFDAEVQTQRALLTSLEHRRAEAWEDVQREAKRLTLEERRQLQKELFGGS